MPQTTPERAERWPGYDDEAESFLKAQGYKLTRRYTWIKPTPEHKPTKREIDAIMYLIEEWDYDGLENISNSID